MPRPTLHPANPGGLGAGRRSRKNSMKPTLPWHCWQWHNWNFIQNFRM